MKKSSVVQMYFWDALVLTSSDSMLYKTKNTDLQGMLPSEENFDTSLKIELNSAVIKGVFDEEKYQVWHTHAQVNIALVK